MAALITVLERAELSVTFPSKRRFFVKFPAVRSLVDVAWSFSPRLD